MFGPAPSRVVDQRCQVALSSRVVEQRCQVALSGVVANTCTVKGINMCGGCCKTKLLVTKRKRHRLPSSGQLYSTIAYSLQSISLDLFPTIVVKYKNIYIFKTNFFSSSILLFNNWQYRPAAWPLSQGFSTRRGTGQQEALNCC